MDAGSPPGAEERAPRLVIAPGSGVLGDGDGLGLELPRGGAGGALGALDALDAGGALGAGGVDLRPRLERLLAEGRATRADEELGARIEVRVGDLLPGRGEVVELRARAGAAAARVELRRAPAPERYEGDPAGVRVLVTGFQPFPADCPHDNVSQIAIEALEPAALRGARVMRLVLPVEYDRAAAAVTEVIARCRPAVVIGFGQGGQGNAALALEEVAYNLQDGGDHARGRPDNRGVVRAKARIDPAAPDERAARLPLGAIEAALAALGEAPRRSRDPGRYVCNDVLFASLGSAAPRAGFIHLPRTTAFDAGVRARFGRIAAAAVQAAVDALLL